VTTAPAGLRIALLGAESTGKTTLCDTLAQALRQRGHGVAVVPEVLREWCTREGRAPRPGEQLPIAREQERRVDEAAAGCAIVVADTTALMVAIYAGMLFEDGELFRFALQRQRSYDLTLVTGLDLPWVPDGLQRDPAQPREPVDALVRQALGDAGVPYRVVYGTGEDRTGNALAPVLELLDARPPLPERERRWAWACERCSDPECEHRLFTALRERG
jgi:nicotinamide riboside kinase